MKYTIKKGDTLSKIARQYGVSLQELKLANPLIKNINKIYAGRTLTIPTKNNTALPPSTKAQPKLNSTSPQSTNENLVPFSQHYPKYGDDLKTPLVYSVGRHLVPESMYETLMVDPRTGQVLITPEVNRQLAMQPIVDALSIKQSLGDRAMMKMAPVFDTFNDLRNLTALFNDTRVANAQRNPTAMKAVQEGGDLAGNIMLSLAATGTLFGIGGRVFTMLRNGQIVELALGALGSYLGHEAGDKLIYDLSSGEYMGLADFMLKEAHIWPFVSETYNPFSYAGGQMFSRIPYLVLNRMVPYLSEVIPAEQVVPEPAQAGYAPGGDSRSFLQGSIYRGQVTTPKVGTVKGKSWSARSGATNKSGNLGKTTGVNPRPEQQTQSWTYLPSVNHATAAIPPTGEPAPHWNPYYLMPNPTPPPPPPPSPLPEPEHQLAEESLLVDPFELWYAQQPEGSVLYWPGALGSNYTAGWIRIDRNSDISHVYNQGTRAGVGKPDNLSRTAGTPAKSYGRSSKRVIVRNSPGPAKHWVRVTELDGSLPDVTLDYDETPISYY